LQYCSVQTELCEGERRGRRDWLLGLALFFLAFLPRTFGLSVFLTPDENLWVGRAVGFMDALSRWDLAATFQVGHPGVTTRWTGAIGILARYWPNVAWHEGQLWLGSLPLNDVPVHLMDVLAATRFPTVLLFSGLVVVVYFLAHRLIGREAALLGAGLLALDPFCLALSRVIHHDALSTVFMTCSALSFAVWLKESTLDEAGLPPAMRCSSAWRWLLFSGATAGLAFLSKSTALFLAPASVAVAFAYCVLRRAAIPYRRLILGLTLWALVAAAMFVILWPAMWVNPLGTVAGVVDKALGYAASPHERDNFFMGQLRADPGPLFYPVATLYRLTPIATIGLFLSWLTLWRGSRRTGEGNGGQADASLWLAIFWGLAISFTVFMTLGAKKFDRYVLPIFPYLNLLAAAGLLEGARLLARFARRGTAWVGAVVVIGSIALQGASSLPAYPYYLTAYNPLLGGIKQAAKVLLIGWGEGYDQAAAYLNARPDAENLNAATWYAKQTMAYLFKGHSWDVRVYHQDPIGVFPWTQADYMVLYINQLQRQIPNQKLLSFFQSLTPDHVVNLAGLDYAWVYRVPKDIPPDISPYQFPVNRDFGGKVRLLGYDVDDGLTEFEGDQYLVITFYWQCLEPVGDNYRLYLKLINAVHHVWGEQESYPVWDGFMTAEWAPGVIIRDVHGIVVKPGTPPGSYLVTVDWLQPYTQQTLPPADGPFTVGPVAVPRQRPPSTDGLDARLSAQLGLEHPVAIDFSDKARLLGYNIEGSYRPGGVIHLELFWLVKGPFERRYTVFNHLVAPDGQLVAQKDNEPVDGFYPTTEWTTGELIRDQYDVPIPPTAPPGVYRIETGLYDAETGHRLPIAGCTSPACQSGDKVVLEDIRIGL
jgi:4-amino-4-deoxy-L-arabinose transferase-like glycosyltransferase